MNTFYHIQDPEEVSHNESEIDPVIVENGTFTWDDDAKAAPILRNISMRVRQLH